MEEIKLLLLALIQGITEPLPISSSGHLVLFENLFGLELPGLYFETLVNFGSLLAVILFYRVDMIKLLKGVKFVYSKEGKDEFKYILYVILATIPALLIGYFFNDHISVFKTVTAVSLFMIFTGVILWVVDKVKTRRTNIVWIDALLIGLAQVVALMPGVSRSGVTVGAGLAREINYEEAVKFSFMMYIPISIATTVYGIYNLTLNGFNYIYIICLLISAVATYFALKLFVWVLRNKKLMYFAGYLVIAGFVFLTISLF